MTEKSTAFDFSQFVPGFDFLKSLTGPVASGGAVPGMPSLSSWVAPTLSVEEVDKRIQELKTVQYWLEQNGHALKATIQALEVQKMTLSTLRGMNVRMEDLANAFTRSAAVASPAAEPAAAPAPAPRPVSRPAPAAAPVAADDDGDEEHDEADEANEDDYNKGKKPAAKSAAGKPESTAGVVDPLQWWGALTQQFQQIASSALQEATKLGTPPDATKMRAAPAAATGAAAKKAPQKKAPARKAARKRAAPRG